MAPPDTASDFTGADWPTAVVYSSTNSACAIPDVMADAPVPTRSTARFSGFIGGAAEGVAVGVAVDVAERVGEPVAVDVNAGEVVGVRELVGVTVAVPDALAPNVTAGVPVLALLGVNELVKELLGETELVTALLGVAVPDGVMLQKSGAVKYGAGVTPRKTVLEGADASTVLTNVTVLYEYSVVGEVRYSMNAPHVARDSFRPAMEMIMVPDSINAPVGTERVQVVPDPVYSAMLLVVSAVVSVDQMAVEPANTKPNGFVAVPTTSVLDGLRVVGRPVNLAIPAP